MLVWNGNMTDITYMKGDATYPQEDGKKLIIHCCNDEGKWGKGFVLAITKRWPEVEKKYREWYRSDENFDLGNIQAVKVEKDIAVVNMIGQHGIYANKGVAPIRYKAIESCLVKVGDLAEKYNASVCAPRFGAGLAGGKWEEIEGMILELLCARDMKVTIYDYD